MSEKKSEREPQPEKWSINALKDKGQLQSPVAILFGLGYFIRDVWKYCMQAEPTNWALTTK